MKVLAVLTLCITACFAANIVDLLKSDSEFSTLAQLVSQAGLLSALQSGTFTIFAPTNDAFAKVPAATLSGLQKDNAALANLLKYHVVQGNIPSSAASNELKVTTLNGKKARFNIYSHNHAVTVEGSKIITFDKTGDNGVIHVIDTVMTPPEGDIVDIVARTSDVSTLLNLVQKANITNALHADGLTVFAPTNAAFSRLSQNVLNHILSSDSLLAEILDYHVVPHSEFSKGLYNRESLHTADRHSDTVSIHAGSYGVLVNNARVTKADIPADNGVIHLIDHVLCPRRYLFSVFVGRK